MKRYRLGAGRRAINFAARGLITLGLGGHYELLTVAGRTTGLPRSTPVRPVRYAGQRWLVAPYGPVSWVRNARAAGEVTLSRGRHQHRFKITEAAPGDSATVLREYARLVPVTRPYFSARPQDPASLFAAEAAAHPVFRLIEDGNPGQPPARPHPGLG